MYVSKRSRTSKYIYYALHLYFSGLSQKKLYAVGYNIKTKQRNYFEDEEKYTI